MIYHLFEALKEYDIPGQGLMTYLSFRAIFASITAMLISLIIGKRIIGWLQKKQIGEEIRDLGLEGQLQKKGTPTMGGIIIIIAAIATGGNSLSVVNIQNLLRQVTVLGFAALGMTVVILTGNIDLSIIGNVSMTTVITAVLMQHELPTPAIILIVLLAGALVGLINGVILNLWKIESFVVTMGMQVVCFGLALLFSDSRTVIVDGELLMSKYVFLKNLATEKILGIPIMFIILIGFYLLFFFYRI